MCMWKSSATHERWDVNSWWNVVYSEVKISEMTIPCYRVEQMSNSHLGISHWRFRNRENTRRDRAYWAALPNFCESLLHWNNCKKEPVLDVVGLWQLNSPRKGSKKIFPMYFGSVSYFPMAVTLPSSVEMRRIFLCVCERSQSWPLYSKSKKQNKKANHLGLIFLSLLFL